MKSIWNYLFSRLQFECNILFPKYIFFREININSLSTSQWIHYLFHEFTFNSLFYSRNHYEFTISFAIFLWIHYFFREFTISFANSLFYSQNHYECTIFRTFTMNSLSLSRIHLESIVFRQITMNSLSALSFTIISLSFSRIHYLFREITMNSLWNNYVITMKSL